MKEIAYNGHILEMYDNIDEMPITRFLEYNVMLSIDANIGGDLEAVSRHIAAIRRYNAEGKKELLEQQAVNMYQSLVFCVEKTNPEMNAFVALIHRMDGRPVEDLSQDGVAKVIKELGRKGLTVGKMRGYLDHIKKKWNRKWNSTSRQWPIAQN